MPLDPADEERLAAVEIKIAALEDYFNEKADHNEKAFFDQKVIENTPEE